ncbi:MAG TPA: APC family permease [Anaerolineaceae bacterium]|nr:APC family permease [Anaerolineaceae bacterium]
MAEAVVKQKDIQQETKKLKRELTLLPLFGLIYFTVCGGSFGVEPLVGYSGPGLTLVLFLITPLLFSIPNMLMVREMNSMMPGEGGYYHWIKQAFGRFPAFMAGWMNWVVAWVDVSIYPVLAAYYLGFFIPALRNGATIGGVDVPAWVLSWIVALVLIWGISYLNLRGARLAGLVTNWLGVIMMLPLVAMSIVGVYNWIKGGTTAQLPFMPEGQDLTGALSTGLFIVMWNFMGWELPTAAGDEIVNPKRTYPLAMVLVLIATIATYAIPTVAGLYGGAGEDGRYLVWGQEEAEEGAGIGPVMADQGVDEATLNSWGVDPTSSVGWEFPDIAHAVGTKATGDPNSPLARILGLSVTLAAVLSMIGLFIGNGLGGTRVPFAMAEDGMMPTFLVKVHPIFGTPWVAIILCGVIFSIFSLQAFSFLVVVDVFLNMLVLLAEFLALWALRFKRPDLERKKVPGGYLGLTLVTLAPAFIIGLAIYSQVTEEGLNSIWLALAAMVIGAILYFPILKLVKPGVPDVDPFKSGDAEEAEAAPVAMAAD